MRTAVSAAAPDDKLRHYEHLAVLHAGLPAGAGQENIVPASLQPRDDIARKAREERVVDGRDGQPHGISPPRPEALCNKVRGVPACPDLVLYFRYGGLAYPVTPALP